MGIDDSEGVRIAVGACMTCQRAIYPPVEDCPRCGTETLTEGMAILTTYGVLKGWIAEAEGGDGHAYIYIETNRDVTSPELGAGQ